MVHAVISRAPWEYEENVQIDHELLYVSEWPHYYLRVLPKCDIHTEQQSEPHTEGGRRNRPVILV